MMKVDWINNAGKKNPFGYLKDTFQDFSIILTLLVNIYILKKSMYSNQCLIICVTDDLKKCIKLKDKHYEMKQQQKFDYKIYVDGLTWNEINALRQMLKFQTPKTISIQLRT